ncbi:MAG: response regulator [Pseudomonadota bacterium]
MSTTTLAQNVTPRILVVDDNEDNVEILEDYLQDEFDVRTALNGEEALELVDAFAPELVLLDIMMPGIDGYEVCRRLRARPDLFDTKIVMLSAKIALEDRLAGYDVGADDYLTKPFDEGELMAKIKVYLQLRRLEETDRLQSALISVLASKVATHDDVLGSALNSIVDGELGDLSGAISAPAEQLSSAMKKTLRLLALRSGSEKPRLHETELDGLIRNVVDEFSAAAKRKSVTLRLNGAPGVRARADKNLLTTALSTLLDHALRASPFYADLEIDLSVAQDIEIRISDRGSAMIDTFQSTPERLDDEDDVELAVSREIARCHLGELSTSSTDGVNTFCFSLGSVLLIDHAHSSAA